MLVMPEELDDCGKKKGLSYERYVCWQTEPNQHYGAGGRIHIVIDFGVKRVGRGGKVASLFLKQTDRSKNNFPYFWGGYAWV